MNKSSKIYDLNSIFELGEGQFIEFKELLDKNLSKEFVAFANASGGVIYLGISDQGIITGIDSTNKLKSQIQDLAYNCDPPVSVLINETGKVLAVEVKEGTNKPYSCSLGFFMRMGAIHRK